MIFNIPVGGLRYGRHNFRVTCITLPSFDYYSIKRSSLLPKHQCFSFGTAYTTPNVLF